MTEQVEINEATSTLVTTNANIEETGSTLTTIEEDATTTIENFINNIQYTSTPSINSDNLSYSNISASEYCATIEDIPIEEVPPVLPVPPFPQGIFDQEVIEKIKAIQLKNVKKTTSKEKFIESLQIL